jgi:L-serine dehydratase
MIQAKMHRQTHAVYEETLTLPESPFKRDMATEWRNYMETPRRLTDEVTAQTLKWAYGAGAGVPGVEVVAGPMGSGGGYIYAALCAVQEAKGFSVEDLLRGLFVAAGVGVLAFTRTNPTGECIGCTGECGICGAMAAAAVAEMAGGTPEQVEHAASLSLQSAIGIPCDPIPGGLGQPCRSRVIAATSTAAVFADLALSGREAVLPLHEVIDVADAVGKRLPPELLCTARGGCAATPTARERATAYREWFERNQAAKNTRPPGNLI